MSSHSRFEVHLKGFWADHSIHKVKDGNSYYQVPITSSCSTFVNTETVPVMFCLHYVSTLNVFSGIRFWNKFTDILKSQFEEISKIVFLCLSVYLSIITEQFLLKKILLVLWLRILLIHGQCSKNDHINKSVCNRYTIWSVKQQQVPIEHVLISRIKHFMSHACVQGMINSWSANSLQPWIKQLGLYGRL